MAMHPREPSRPKGAGQGRPAPNAARRPAAAPLRVSAEPAVEVERVARALARAGVSSRRDAEKLIEAGRVAINGQVLTSPAVNVGPGDIVTLDGAPIAEPEPVRVWRYHKPTGLLTTHKDPKGRPTVFETLPSEMGRVISVGRLDLNSEGILLLTNDGALARALELPSSGWIRRYRARAFGRITQEKLDGLKRGVTVEGVNYGPVEAVLEQGGSGSNIWINVAITEGKNREVRRVLEHVGLKVNRLIRIAYGPFELGDLAAGAVAEIPPRVIREKLVAAVDAERLPKGDRKLFNWVPERRSVAATGRVFPHAAPPTDAGEEERPAAKPQRPHRPQRRQAEAGERARPPNRGEILARLTTSPDKPKTKGKPSRARSGPASDATAAKAKPAYKAGWARPKAKAAPGASGKAAGKPAAKPAASRGKPRPSGPTKR